jgi:hypothetical protein
MSAPNKGQNHRLPNSMALTVAKAMTPKTYHSKVNTLESRS